MDSLSLLTSRIAAGLEWLTTTEAALYCRLSRNTFRSFVTRTGIKPARPAGPNGEPRYHVETLRSALRSTAA